MSEQVVKLLEQIMALEPEERDELLDAVAHAEKDADPPPDPYPDEAARDAELQRRIDAVASGMAELIPWDKAMEQARAELARRRAYRGPGASP